MIFDLGALFSVIRGEQQAGGPVSSIHVSPESMARFRGRIERASDPGVLGRISIFTREFIPENHALIMSSRGEVIGVIEFSDSPLKMTAVGYEPLAPATPEELAARRAVDREQQGTLDRLADEATRPSVVMFDVHPLMKVRRLVP